MISKHNDFKRSLVAAAVGIAVGMGSSVAIAGSDQSKGFLQGVVASTSGIEASGVTVTIVNQETGLTRTVVTDQDGQYKFPLLPAGTYKLTTSSDEFETLTETVTVGLGDKTIINLNLNRSGETITVVGSAVAKLDTASTEQSYVFSDDDLKRMPVARNLTGVALLAPGVVRGDTAFGNLPSFGGSSVAENIYLVNGLNITSHRDGLAFTNVPFEFYDTFNVKNGGWSAEFGRALGGALITTTRRGTNEFEAGASAYLIDDSMQAHGRDVDSNDDSGLWINQSKDTSSTVNFNVWAGGALIKDKLFVYGLLNPRKVKTTNIGNTVDSDTDRTDLFYGLKMDYYLSDDHILEFTAFGDDRNYDVNVYAERVGQTGKVLQGPYVREVGGNNFILNYTGVITEDITVSAMYGRNDYKNSSFVDAQYDVPCAFHRDTGQRFNGYVLCTNVNQEDTRDQFRADIDWYVGDHTLRFGIDYEALEAKENTHRSGGVVYRYDPGQGNPNGDVRIGYYDNNGSFETTDWAIYFEDTWEITPDLVLKLGLRNDAFENKNQSGDVFVDIADQWAPRLGVAYDPVGNGEDKLFASFGRYYLGVATNTNVRLAGSEFFTRQFCDNDGPDQNGVPTNVTNCGSVTVYGDGQQRSTAESVNASLEPMYEDEFIVGYQKEMDDWVAGIKWTYRVLGESLEDIAIDAGFNAFLADQGETCTNCSGFHYYVLTNPGSGTTTITTDPNGGNNPQTYSIPNSYLGYPEAKRSYKAWDLEFSHPWDGDYALTILYTWSHSEGNNEGWVRSDNGQTDAGLTTNFDQPGLTDFAYGDLPNDRRHQVKIYGTKAITDNLTAGFNFGYQTGRPINAFGVHPTDDFASLYGAASFYACDENGDCVPAPRGSLGRLKETWQLDLNAKYTIDMSGHELTLGVDIFNVFNNDEITEVNEVHDQIGGFRFDGPYGFAYTGVADPNYGLPTAFQNPRYVRLSASFKF